MLLSFELESFKSYSARATVPFAELTVLIGANASGKSNLLEALQLLSWIAHGRRLGDLPYAMEKHELPLRGHLADLSHQPGAPIKLACSFANEQGTSSRLEIEITANGRGCRVVAESYSPGGPGSGWSHLYQVVRPASDGGNDLSVSYNNFAKGGTKPHITCTDQQAVFTQLLTPARFAEGHTRAQREIPAACAHLQRVLERLLVLDPLPSAMRGYSFPSDAQLHGDGSNLSGVLARLCETPERRAQLLDFVRQLPEQDIAAIDFIRTPRGEAMIELHETFAGVNRPCSAALLSDGTLRALAIAAALWSVPPGTLVVIEEVDNGVHPSRARGLLERARTIATQRGLRVLLSTHNPALLDALPEESIGDVVFCYRDPAGGHSRLMRLRDHPQFTALAAQGPLGALMTEQIIDRVVKHPEDAATRAAKARKLLAGLADGLT